MELPKTASKPVYDLAKERILIYGEPGVGKSTVAAQFPNVIFAATEQGQDKIECHKIRIDQWTALAEMVKALKEQQHDFKTLVIDTVDIAYLLCRKFWTQKLGVDHEADSDKGKGYDLCNNAFRFAINQLETLNMGVVLIAHNNTEKIKAKSRAGNDYNRFFPAFSNKPLSMVTGWVDHVLFFQVEDSEQGENRRIRCQPSQYYMAKSRGSMFADDCDMSYEALKAEYERNVEKNHAAKQPGKEKKNGNV